MIDHTDFTDLVAVNDLETIDRICAEFEQQLKRGSKPAIEGCLEGHDGNVRTALLAELIKLDVDYQGRSGQSPTKAEYLARFPNETNAVDSVFASVTELDRNPPFRELELTNRYEFIRFHARGGLGEIYLANDKQLGRMVAIKFPRNRDPGSPDHIRLSREAEITSRLKHPGIVPVYATNNRQNGLPCYIMQFVEGQTLRDAVVQFHTNGNDNADKFRSREFRKLLQNVVSVCNTVAYVHQQGVIHRDIKPSNIMLGSFGETFLLDWGVAKVMDESQLNSTFEFASTAPTDAATDRETWPATVEATPGQTQPGQPIGTPEFASPEQVRGDVQQHGPQSDVYSLGATLYFLLVGKRAIELEQLTNLATASAIKKILPPRHFDPHVPSELNAICMKAISFETENRYRNVQNLAEDLDRFLADEPVAVAKQSLPNRIRRWLRRNPRLASGLASGMVVTLIGVSVGAWMLGQKAEELTDLLAIQNKTNTELQEAKQTAEERADDTLEALRTLSNRVVQQWFVKRKNFSTEEVEFMEDILQQYVEFADSQNDESYSRTIEAEGLRRISQIQMLLGRNDDASESVDKAIKLLTPLPENADQRVVTFKATLIFDAGQFLFRKRAIEAGLSKMEEGIEVLRLLTIKFPNEPRHRELLANAQSKLGATYVDLKQSDKALKMFYIAKETTGELVEQFPENVLFLKAHGSKLTNIGVALSQKGEFEGAIEAQIEKLAIDEKLRDRDELKDDVYHFSGTAISLNSLAQTYARAKRYDDALKTYERAVTSGKEVVELFPSYPDGHLMLARSHEGIAAIHRRNANYEIAISESRLATAAAQKSVQLKPDASKFLNDRAYIHVKLAMALKKNGDTEQAEREYRTAVKFHKERFENNPVVRNRIEFARTLNSSAQLQNLIGLKSDAVGNFKNAVQLLESDDSAQSNTSYSEIMSTAGLELGKLLVVEGKYADAIPFLDHSIKYSNPNTVLARTIRAVCTAMSDPQQTIEEIEALRDLVDTGEQQYNLAKASGLTAGQLDDDEKNSGAKRYTIEALIRANELGYFDSENRQFNLGEDPSFVSLNGDEQFAELVARINRERE